MERLFRPLGPMVVQEQYPILLYIGAWYFVFIWLLHTLLKEVEQVFHVEQVDRFYSSSPCI